MRFEDWGLIPYEQALNRQLETLEKVAQGDEDVIVFCTHAPVVTLGRSTEAGDVTTWEGDIVEIQRGGRATYHGPNQLVVYPILNLNNFGRDLHWYLRKLEDIIVTVLRKFDLQPGTVKDATGVWVGNRKIASIGIGVKKWVTYHGLALNVVHDPKAFKGLKPCGFTTETMISMEELCGKKIDREILVKSFYSEFTAAFSARKSLDSAK